MARKLPVIPDQKVQFFRDKLVREVSNLFKWTGLPDEIPVDYLEHSLITHGRVMFFYDDNLGYLAFRCGVRGFNIYDQPTVAFADTPNEQGIKTHWERTIVHRYDKNIEKNKACVVINNMYRGESLYPIINFYAKRLALIQQAFDVNALWQTKPVLFITDDKNTELSIQKMFSEIFDGKPWIIGDRVLFREKGEIQGNVIDVPYLLDRLQDAKNMIYNEFKQSIGIDTIAIDKKERLTVDEARSGKQYTKTCLQIMLQQRQLACEEIKMVFGLDVSVDLVADEEEIYIFEGDDEDGTGNDRAEASSTDERL